MPKQLPAMHKTPHLHSNPLRVRPLTLWPPQPGFTAPRFFSVNLSESPPSTHTCCVRPPPRHGGRVSVGCLVIVQVSVAALNQDLNQGPFSRWHLAVALQLWDAVRQEKSLSDEVPLLI